jgi:hypothetical protein
MKKAVTEWCDTTDDEYQQFFDTPSGRFGFCSTGLADAGWVVPRDVKVRIQIRDEYVKGASCDVPSTLCASMYIYDTMRAEGMDPHEAAFWWPEVLD